MSEKKFKRQAKALKKITGEPYRKCLDEVVRQNGYKHWNDYLGNRDAHT